MFDSLTRYETERVTAVAGNAGFPTNVGAVPAETQIQTGCTDNCIQGLASGGFLVWGYGFSVAAGLEGAIRRVAPDGTVDWTNEAAGYYYSGSWGSVALDEANSKLFFGVYTNDPAGVTRSVICLDLDTGALLWTSPSLSGSGADVRCLVHDPVADVLVVLRGNSSQWVLLDASTGALLEPAFNSVPLYAWQNAQIAFSNGVMAAWEQTADSFCGYVAPWYSGQSFDWQKLNSSIDTTSTFISMADGSWYADPEDGFWMCAPISKNTWVYHFTSLGVIDAQWDAGVAFPPVGERVNAAYVRAKPDKYGDVYVTKRSSGYYGALARFTAAGEVVWALENAYSRNINLDDVAVDGNGVVGMISSDGYFVSVTQT